MNISVKLIVQRVFFLSLLFLTIFTIEFAITIQFAWAQTDSATVTQESGAPSQALTL